MVGDKQSSSYNHASFEFNMLPELESIGDPADKFIQRKRALIWDAFQTILVQQCDGYQALYREMEQIVTAELDGAVDET